MMLRSSSPSAVQGNKAGHVLYKFVTMAEGRLELSDKVLQNLKAQGEQGAAWLAQLPELLAEFKRDWGIEVGRAFESGTEAFVAEAAMADGTPAVVKIPIPGVEKADREFRVLAAADGRGYARVFRHDPATNAILLERLGAQLAQSALPIEQQIEIICATLREAWNTPAAGLQLMTGAEKALSHANTIRSVKAKFPSVCSGHLADIALRFAQARHDAFDPAASVVGHGDAHAWNTLLDPKTGRYKFVDPDGLFIEPAFDLAITLREVSTGPADDPLILGRRRCALLATLSGVGEEPIWQWGLVERLVNGLLYKEVGSDALASTFIDMAEIWAKSV